MDANQTFDSVNSICVLPHEITDDQWAFYHAFAWWLEGFGTVLMGCLGIFLNLTTVWVLLAGELAASFLTGSL